jgi:transposase
MKAAGRPPANGKKKGGVKIHVGMQAIEDMPSVVRITSAATHDVTFLKSLGKLPAGSILVFDKAYFDYKCYNEWQEQGIYWVTRLKKWSVVNVEQKSSISEKDQQQGVRGDQIVELGHQNQEEKIRCRLVYYYDEQRDKMFHFITNDFDKPAYQIAEIYRKRWQIELLFKRLKQNLQLSNFLGDNENAIRIQIWCNLLADLLLMVIKNGIKRNWAYSNIAAIVRIHLMNYINIKELLSNVGKKVKGNATVDAQMEFAEAMPP